MPKRPKGVESIPAPWWGTVASHLQAEGVGKDEAMRAIPDGQGPKALAEWVRGRLDQEQTPAVPTTASPKRRKIPERQQRFDIQSWEDFLLYWKNCRTRQEAIALVLSAGERHSWRSSLHLTVPEARDGETPNAYYFRVNHEIARRFHFLIDVEQNDPDAHVRYVANTVLWNNFILQYEPNQYGYLSECDPEVLPAVIGFISKELASGYPIEATAQFLCTVVGARHSFLWINTFNDNIESLVKVALALERREKELDTGIPVGHRWNSFGKLVIKILWDTGHFGKPEVERPDSLLPVDRRDLIAALRSFLVVKLTERLTIQT